VSDVVHPTGPTDGPDGVHSTEGPEGTVARAGDDPISDPGLGEHLPRPTDVDPAAERRAERQIATLFGLSSVMAVLFCVAYFVFDTGENPDTFLGFGISHVSLGITLGLALLFIGIGAIQWSRKLMNDTEIAEERHALKSSDADREATVAALTTGANDSGIARRPLIRNSLLGAMGALALPAVVALRDLGPLPGDVLYHTVWKEGMRIVNDVAGTPIKPEWLRVGQLVNAEPEVFYKPEDYGAHEYEGAELQAAKSKAALIVVRMQPDDITPAKGRENWGVEGILAFSKICTHVGCPISLWEQQTHHLLCPCHQSTFDLADNGKVIFGPAARALPQLPIAVDSDGYLIATSDFKEPVGPSFWERG
jgi:ubiquinol-cytochrome c reductase iron-sulfur subunit